MRNGGSGGPFWGRSRRSSPDSERTAHLPPPQKTSLEMQKQNVFF